MVRRNETKRKMKAGQVVFGVTVGAPEATPAMVETLGLLGFDYLDVVCENDLFDPARLEDVFRAADLGGMNTILRTPYDPRLILRALNAGAQGILATRVASLAEVQAVLDAAKFHPEGRRTVFHGGRAGSFGRDVNAPEGSNPEMIGWTHQINEETIVGCTIEEKSAVDELDAILALPALDFIGIGPGDLAHSMGWPPQSEVDALTDRIREASVEAGKTVFIPASVEDMPQALEKGFRAFAFSPRGALQAAAAAFLEGGRAVVRSKGLSD